MESVGNSSLGSLSSDFRLASESVLKDGQWPDGFGAALQAPLKNPKGSPSHVLRDGADDAISMGIRTFKINLSRGMIGDNNINFYRIQDPRINTVSSLVELAQIPQIKYVLDRPFETIFIDADNIGLHNRTPIPGRPGQFNNYWEFDNHRMQQTDLDAVYKETYDFAKFLLTTYSNQSRVFVIQNHEGDSHTTPDAHPHSVPTDIGLANFKDYWTMRQNAIEKARSEVASQAKIYHMCEIVKVKKFMDHPNTDQGKSLLRDVLPHVTCDLVGYSAHDTAIIPGDNQASLLKAIQVIRNTAKPSPTFGWRNVVISEIAVPEVLNNGMYVGMVPNVAKTIRELLQQGLPWVIYWQLYNNDISLEDGKISGNWLRRDDGSLSYMSQALESEFRGGTFYRTPRPEYVQSSVISAPGSGTNQGSNTGGTSPSSCNWVGGSVAHGSSIVAYASSSVSSGSSCQSQVRTCTNGVLSGSYSASSCSVQSSSQAPVVSTKCMDRNLVGLWISLSPNPSGVHPNIKQMYGEVLGGIGRYSSGAVYLSGLLAQGYTLQSLRNDLINDPTALQSRVNELYQAYLNRNIASSDFNNVKNYLRSGGTLRSIEQQIVNSPECKAQ